MNDAAREALAGLFIRHANRWCRTCGQRGELCHNPHTGERIAFHPIPLCSDPFPGLNDAREEP